MRKITTDPAAKMSGKRRREQGFALLEVMVAIMVMLVALLGLSSLLVWNSRSQETVEQEAIVTNVLRSVAERVRGAPFTACAATYQDFAFGIDELDGDGTITVFLDETDNSSDALSLGLPRDLDGDGAASNTDVSGSYALLPVKISVSWPGRDRTETQDLYLLLSQDD